MRALLAYLPLVSGGWLAATALVRGKGWGAIVFVDVKVAWGSRLVCLAGSGTEVL